MEAMKIRNLRDRYRPWIDLGDFYNGVTKINCMIDDDFQVSICDNMLREYWCHSVAVLTFTDWRVSKNDIDLDLIFDYIFIGFKTVKKKEEFIFFMGEKTSNLDFQIIQ